MPKVHRYPRVYNQKTRSYQDYERVKWSAMTKKEVAIHVSKRFTQLAAITGLVVAVLPEGPIDILGDMGRNRTKAEMDVLVKKERNEIFSQDLSASERFSLSYLGSSSLGLREDITTTIEVTSHIEHNGLLGIFGMMVHGTNDVYGSPGENCLAGTSYDITPSEIRGRARGDISAVASIALEDGQTVVYAAATDAAALRFVTGDEGYLMPDDQTSEILSAYGCAEPK